MNYLPPDSAERVARDSYRTPLLKFGQGEYTKEIHNHDAERMLFAPWLIVCAIVEAAACLVSAWL